jgi:DNA-binding NarL/FixJ family response regulator
MHDGQLKSVIVCDSQPMAIEGIRALLSGNRDLRFAGGMTSMAAASELVNSVKPAVVLIDKAFGVATVLDYVRFLSGRPGIGIVVWGVGLNSGEALRLVQGGVRGVIRRTSDTDSLLLCLRAVSRGHTWMEEAVNADVASPRQERRSNLTAREHQVVELVEKGLRNRDIAESLGIRTGTVKIHLRHIFEKTGCRGRYGLALTGLQEKGMLTLQN